MTDHSPETSFDPLQTAEAWIDARRQLAVPTVLDTWGSAPFP